MRKLTDDYPWEEVVENVANQIGRRNPNFNKKKFVEWYITKEYVGKPFDPTLIYFAWKGYKRLYDDKDNITVICGLEGEGKSTLGINYCSLISPSFNFDSTCYDSEEFKKNLREGIKGDSVLADEGGVILFSREAMKRENKNIIKILTAIRERNLNLVVCVPNFFIIDSYIREHRVNTLIQIRKRGYYRGYLREGIAIINRNAKHKDVLGVKLGSDKFWDGNFNKELPKDYDYVAYKKKKNKNINKSLEPSREEQDKLNNNLMGGELIKLSVVAKKLNVSLKSIDTIMRKNNISVKKIATYKYIKVRDYNDLISMR